MFAIITVALISGAIADRAKFGPWMVFAGIWATLVYFPVAHWVFAFDGARLGHAAAGSPTSSARIDFAGGTAVHINAGAAGLALALVLGKRVGWKRDPMRPHNLTLVMLGAGLLWFGWFGFNAGSALGANDAGRRWSGSTRMVATGAGRPRLAARSSGSATVTPPRWAPPPASSPAWSRSPRPARRSPRSARSSLGCLAGVVCALAVGLKYRFGFDDSLDVVGVHLVGGLWGTLAVGLLATRGRAGRRRRAVLRRRRRPAWQAGRRRASSVLIFSFVVTFVIGLADREDDRLPDRRGGRGRGHRPGRARRDGVRPRHARAAAAPAPAVTSPPAAGRRRGRR